MFCKYCGKQIANDSTFCQYCGGKQDLTQDHSEGNSQIIEKVEVTGSLNASLSPSFPKVSSFLRKYQNLVIIYVLWFLTNVVLLLSGDEYDYGFWPNIYKQGGYYKGGSYIKATIHVDWDIDCYGWPEFVIYTFLVPLIVFFIVKSGAFKTFWKRLQPHKNVF